MNKFSFGDKYSNPYSNKTEKRNNHSSIKVVSNDKYSCSTLIVNCKKGVHKKENNIKLKAINEWVK